MYFVQTLSLVLCIAVTLCEQVNNSALVLPQGSGPYHSSYREYELVDHSRADPFNSSHGRRLMVSRFDPVKRKDCQLVKQQYIHPEVTDVFGQAWLPYGVPVDVWPRFALEVCENKSYSSSHKKGYPTVLFSPGLGASRLLYANLAQEIASHGFTIITIDHTYDVDPVVFPDGTIIRGGRVTPRLPENNYSTVSLEFGMDVRTKDASFVLDTLGTKKGDTALMFGQSFGGATAISALQNDKRFRAGVNLDGTMHGKALNTSLGSPGRSQAFMLWGSELPVPHGSEWDETWRAFLGTNKGNPYVDYGREFAMLNSMHPTYTDLFILADIAGVSKNLTGVPEGVIPGKRAYEILGKYLLKFFRYALGKQDLDEILKGHSPAYPEISIVETV